MSDRPWLKKPGELYDRRGVPIYPGDLLRTPHFCDSRRRQHYLYHTAVYHDDGKCRGMRMVPTAELEPTLRGRGGNCLLSQEIADTLEVIAGHGPGDCLCYTDRPRRKAERREM